MYVWFVTYYSTWGEAFFIAIQVFAIVCLMFLIERKLLHMVVFVLVYLGVSYCFIAEIIPMEILQTLQGSTILLMIISKVYISYLTSYLFIVKTQLCSISKIHKNFAIQTL